MVKAEYQRWLAQLRGNPMRDPLGARTELAGAAEKALFQCCPAQPVALTRWLIRPEPNKPFVPCDTPPLPMSKGQVVFVLAPRGWQVAGIAQRSDGKSSVVSFSEVPIDG
jgi:hypothetical protein